MSSDSAMQPRNLKIEWLYCVISRLTLRMVCKVGIPRLHHAILILRKFQHCVEHNSHAQYIVRAHCLHILAGGKSLSQHLLKRGGLLNGKEKELHFQVTRS